MNVNEQMIARIAKVLPKIRKDSFDLEVLTYIKKQLTPEAIAERLEDDEETTTAWVEGDLALLRDTASRRMYPYEKEADHG